jgi:hypothetical protein
MIGLIVRLHDHIPVGQHAVFQPVARATDFNLHDEDEYTH